MTGAQRALVGLVFVIAVVGGGVLALALLGGGGPGASPTPVAAASPSIEPATPTPAPATPGAPPTPSAPPTASPTPSASPSPSPSPSASPTPTPTVGPGNPTVVVITALKLDAADDPDGRNRRLSFRAQGTGMANVAVRTLSPMGNVVLCLFEGGDRVGCRTSATGTLSVEATGRRADYVVTLRGEGIAAPVVEVTLTFPARTPRLTIENARFDGTLYPETNGLQLFISPRSDGDVQVSAAWGGHPFNYEIDLLEQGGPGSHVLANQGPATGADAALPVTPGNPWKLLLQNINEGFGVTPLEATISWP